MAQDFLSAAREQAEQSDPPVKAAALLRIARVWKAFDQAEAERLLERGITLATKLPEPDRSRILEGAVSLAAAVSPRRALRLMSSLEGPGFGRSEALICGMMIHGHVAEAASYLCEPIAGMPYPFSGANNAISLCREEETQRKIVRAAVATWLAGSESRYGHSRSQFLRLFNHRWKLLPEDEAKEAVRGIVRLIVDKPDERTNSRMSGGVKTVVFSSTHSASLFHILNPLRNLDPELATSLCERHPELAVASATYPYGYVAEPTRPRAERVSKEDSDCIAVGETGMVPISEALKTNFAVVFEDAFRVYALDSPPGNRNKAPLECWPSTNAFRNLLYKAGKYEGRAAARHLDRSPEADLRLFAQIELAAAIAGLPQAAYTNIPSRPRSPIPSQV